MGEEDEADGEIMGHDMASAQRVPEPDPLPGIFFDTRPDPTQVGKSSGSG